MTYRRSRGKNPINVNLHDVACFHTPFASNKIADKNESV